MPTEELTIKIKMDASEVLDYAIKFVKLSPSAKLPTRANPAAVGMDLYADEHKSIMPMSRALVHTNIAMSMPDFFEAQIRARSGLALKHGIMVVNAPGTIDPDYRGEIGVILFNSGTNVFHIAPGDRIAQMVINHIWRPEIIEAASVEELGETDRGAGGYGSTGSSDLKTAMTQIA
jgi:dUTP pyrophosphatase